MERVALQYAMKGKDIMLLEVIQNPFGSFLERKKADLGTYGALYGTQHHTIVAQPNPSGAGLRLWDPWSGPTGQPFEVSWDDLWDEEAPGFFGFVGVLLVYSVQEGLRVPVGEGDRV